MFLNYSCKFFVALMAGLLVWPVNIAWATDFQMPPSVAQADEGGAKSAKSLVSKGTYKLLVDAQKSIDKGRIDEAFEKLNAIILRVQKNTYESAVVIKTAGYLYLQREDHKQAIELLKVSLSMNALVEQNQQKLRYDLAQLSMAEEDYDSAIHYLKDWLERAPEDESKTLALVRLGKAYIQLERYALAAEALEQGLEEKRANSESPSEQHLQLLLTAYVLLDAHEKAVSVLRQLMVIKPKKTQYPLRLVAVYDELEQAAKALASLEYAYKQGLLQETQQLSNLAYRLISRGYPYKAAKVLEEGLASFVLWRTPENLNLLARAYLDSGQTELAIPYLEKALLTTQRPAPGQILAQIYLSNERYVDAIRSFESALVHSSGQQALELTLALAHTYWQSGQLEPAMVLLERLYRDPDLNEKTRRQVEDWRRYLSAS